MNKFAHFFLVGIAVAIMTLFAALALSNELDARASESALHASVTASAEAGTLR